MPPGLPPTPTASFLSQARPRALGGRAHTLTHTPPGLFHYACTKPSVLLAGPLVPTRRFLTKCFAVIQLCVKTPLSKGPLHSGLRNTKAHKRRPKLNLEIQTGLSGVSMEGEAPGIGALFPQVSSPRFFFSFGLPQTLWDGGCRIPAWSHSRLSGLSEELGRNVF